MQGSCEIWLACNSWRLSLGLPWPLIIVQFFCLLWSLSFGFVQLLLLLMFEDVSAYDSLIWLLISSACFWFFFSQLCLESLVDKDATEKSDAAREAFLAELALDAKKNINRGNDSKHAHEKSRDKKKNRDYRKIKDQKVVKIPAYFNFPILLICLYDVL